MKRLLDLYSQNRQYERAYEMAKPIRQKLELSFSVDSSQRLAELEKAVERYVGNCGFHTIDSSSK